MKISLEAIDSVIDRTGATFKEAKEALEKTKGNVLDAIIYLEETLEVKPKKTIAGETAKNALKSIKHFIAEGNVTNIVVESKDGNKYLDLPINASIPGIVFAPHVAVGYIVACFAMKCSIQLHLKNGDIVDISEKTARTARGFAVKSKDLFEKAKSNTKKAYDKTEPIRKKAKETVDGIVTDEVKENIKETAKKAKDKVSEVVSDDIKDGIKDTVKKAKDTIKKTPKKA